jgi:hypothetical protein
MFGKAKKKVDPHDELRRAINAAVSAAEKAKLSRREIAGYLEQAAISQRTMDAVTRPLY